MSIPYEGEPSLRPPLQAEHFLQEPTALRDQLTASGTLNFTPYASGLFPASQLPAETAEATGMGLAWLRDNAHIASALYEAGEYALAIPAGEAMLQVLANHRDVLDGVVSGSNRDRRLPVRVHGNDLTVAGEDRAFPRHQNDSTGYALWYVSRLARDGMLPTDPDTLELLAQTARYLGAIAYWQDYDEGHWEEDRRLNASSVGVAVAGLRAVRELFAEHGYPHHIHDLDELIRRGDQKVRQMLLSDLASEAAIDDLAMLNELDYLELDIPRSVRSFLQDFNTHERDYDASLLFLVEPLGIFEGATSYAIVAAIEHELKREKGVIRYPGDTYWMARFDSIMSEEERTHAAEGRTEARNQKAAGTALTETEAQWTLFDPLLSTYWGRLYQQTGDSYHRERQLHYLNRSLAQLVPTADGRLLLPETYYYDYRDGENAWVPNPHMPLLWSQANLLRALRQFEQTTRLNGSYFF